MPRTCSERPAPIENHEVRIRMSRALHRDLRLVAARRGCTMKEVVAEYLIAALQAENKNSAELN